MSGKFVNVIFKKTAPSGLHGFGKVESVGKAILAYYQKTGIYDIEIVDDKVKTAVGASNTVKEIKSYLNLNKIDYTSAHDTKAKLLALIDA